MDTTIRPDIVAFPFTVKRRDGMIIIVELPDDGTPVGLQGHMLMELESEIRKRFGGFPFEVYLETTSDGNKPRAAVMERVKDWRERRLKMAEEGRNAHPA